MTKTNLKDTYLIPFDPFNHDGPFGFGYMRANITGREQWWLVQVWTDETGDEDMKMIRFFDMYGPEDDFTDNAENFAGRPWYPLQWIADEVPTGFAPAFRLTLDMPGGTRLTHEWGPEPIGDAGRKTIDRMIEKACAGLEQADGDSKL